LNNTEKLLIEILSAFINGREPEITTEYDASLLYEISKKQSVSGIVGHILQKYGKNDIISAEDRFALIFDKTITQLVRKEVYAQKLFERLSQEKIPHIIIKGLVVKEFYPVPELRTYGDIDIIIPKNLREKSHTLMCSLGYKWELMDGGEVYAYKKDLERYEFHTTLNSEKTQGSEYMNNFWEHTKPLSGLTYEFEDELHLCYLISHIEKHVYTAGAGVRMYMDIALLLNKLGDSLDFDKVREILRECELERFFDSVLFLCSRWFDCKIKPLEPMSEEVYEEFCRFTFRGGVFGKQAKEDTVNAEIRQSIDEKGKAGKFSVILSHIFPPYREIRRIYPFFNGKPYLLPLGWCVHIFKAGKRSGLRNLKQIATADVSKAQNEKDFLEQIGSKR